MNTKTFLLAVLTVLFTCAIASAQVEEITLSTYYPAPYGEYEEMAAEKLFADKVIIGNMDVDGDGDYSDSDDIALMSVGSLLIENNVGIGTAWPKSTLDVSTHHDYNVERTITAESVHEANRYGLGFKYWTNAVGTTFKTITEYEGANEYNTLSLKDGNVGIGTTSPDNPLHIYRAGANSKNVIHVEQTGAGDSYAGLLISIDDVTTNYASFDDAYTIAPEYTGKSVVATSGGPLALFSWGWDVGEIQMYTGGRAAENRRVTIDKDGNVGIGTTSPQAKLHVGGTPGPTNGIMFPDGSLQTRAAKIYSAIGTTDISVDSANWTTMSGTAVQIPSNFGGGDIYIHFNAAIRKRGWMWVRLVLDIGTGSQEVLIETPQTDLMSGVNYGTYGYAGGPPVSLSYVKEDLSSGSHTITAQWRGNLSQDGALSPRVMTVITGG